MKNHKNLDTPEWQKFFSTIFPCVDSLLDAMPKTEYSKATIVSYYINLHPGIKKYRQWIDKTCAIILKEKDEGWRKFFEEKFKTSEELIGNIPKNSTLSKTTILLYYIASHPEIKDSRRWADEICAVALARKNDEWKSFFEKEFKTPVEMIAEIPKKSTMSIASITRYYLTLNPGIKSKRRWLDLFSVNAMMKSDDKWKNFFKRKFKTPREMIAEMPKGSALSKASTATYYLTFHPEIKRQRRWIDEVCAIVLTENDEAWKVFFEKKFESPKEMISRIPKKSTQSKATIATYYLIFHPEIVEQRLWLNAVCGYIFCNNNQGMGVKLINREISPELAKEKYSLKQKADTVRFYLRALQFFDFKKEDIFKKEKK